LKLDDGDEVVTELFYTQKQMAYISTYRKPTREQFHTALYK